MQRVVVAPMAADLARASEIVRRHLGPTPVVAGPDAVLKLECLQPTGSFKVRGALVALEDLAGPARAAGVVTASAGNHGLGVAYAAGVLGIAATIVVPTTASPSKVAALRDFPVTLVEHGDDYAAAERHALAIAATGPTYVSAYNDAPVIAGNVVEVAVGATLADGLAGNLEPGSVTPALVAAHTHALVTVTEPEIRHAMRVLAKRYGLVAEGSGAVGVAALLAGKVDVAGRPVAIVTGRNITLTDLAGVLTG
jgi:threonine dehydratase